MSISNFPDNSVTAKADTPVNKSPTDAMLRVGAEIISFPETRFPGLPEGRSIHSDGSVYRTEPAKKAGQEPSQVLVCSAVRVTELFRNRDGSGWGRRIVVTSPDGREHVLSVLDDRLETHATAVINQLVYHGLRIGTGPKAWAHVIDTLKLWEPEKVLFATNRRGWADDASDAFVLSDGRVIGNPDVISVATDLSPLADAIKSRGELADWKAGVGALCVGNPLMLAAVSLAFVGPLLELLGRDGGGLHLRGVSSRGKTTLQRAAASVWGAPEFVQGWRTTANALEGTAAACNGMLLVLDELAEVDGRHLFDAVYMLANGKGKARANSYGQVGAVRRWKLAMLSSGEIGVAEKIAEGGRRMMGGQEVRLLDIAADARLHGAFDDLHGCTDGAAFAKQVTSQAATSYGTAGPAYVEWLLRDQKLPVETIRKLLMGFRNLAGDRFEIPSDGLTSRAVDWFALIAVAGHLATLAGITGWAKGSATEGALEVLGEWLDARAPDAVGVDGAVVDRTRRFLAANASEFLTPGPLTAGATTPMGWRDANLFYIPAATWKLIHDGCDPEIAGRALLREDLLLPGDGANLMPKGPRSIEGRPRFYTVKARILDGDGIGGDGSEMPSAA